MKSLLSFLNKLSETKLPWFLSSRIDKFINSYFYFKNRFSFFIKKRSQSHLLGRITFNCGFHGTTGAVDSIANVANILSKKYSVEFYSFPASNFNSKLNDSVKIVSKINLNSELFFCDLSCEINFFKELKKLEKKLLLSCHGMLNSQYGLSADKKLEAISYADLVQFVSPVQQLEYQLEKNRYVIVPNMVKPVKKLNFTNSVGAVGNLNLLNKNAEASVNIALASKADKIHLWSLDDDRWDNDRVVVHGWEKNKEKVYASFDVLVFMSKEEALSMVVLEAMSAGIPCLLSNIPAFEQFSGAPGVYLVEPSDINSASDLLNQLLNFKESLKTDIIEYWESNYSERVVSEQWIDLVSNLVKKDT